MATARQRAAARRNIRKARKGRRRAKPGTAGTGDYFRVVIRDKGAFASFRTHDVGRTGHVQRLAGRRASGTWATQAWLIAKSDAHRDGDRLVGDTVGVRRVLRSLRRRPTHVKGDVFRAPAQQRARKK
jgi:hypothetical protein